MIIMNYPGIACILVMLLGVTKVIIYANIPRLHTHVGHKFSHVCSGY